MKQIPLALGGSDTYLTLGAGNFAVTTVGSGDTIYAGPGNININSLGNHNIFQITATARNTVTISMHGASDTAIVSGAGSGNIMSSGPNATIAVSGGVNTIQAGGQGDTIISSDGAAFITANNDYDQFAVLGTSGQTQLITANGYNDKFGLNSVSGFVQAAGGHDYIGVFGGTPVVNATGWHDEINIESSKTTLLESTFDTNHVDGNTLGTVISESGIYDVTFITGNASATIKLGPAADQVNIFGIGGSYAGITELIGLGANIIDLHQITGLDTYAQVQAAITHAPGGWKLPTPGGGEVLFMGEKPTAANFAFT